MSSKIRILYIEHNESIAYAFKETLKPFKYAIDLAATGRAGAQLFTTHAYDLIVITHDLPDENSIDLVDAAQQSPTPPAILFLTPADDQTLAATALRHGANDYLNKNESNDYLTLLPLVVRNMLRRQQIEKERLDMLFTLQSRNNTLKSLNGIASKLSSILEPSQVIEQLMRSAIDLLNAEGGSLWLWVNDSQQQEVVCQAVIHRTGPPPLMGIRKKRGEGVVGWVAERGQSTILHRAATDERFQSDVDAQINFTTQSLMAVPLRARSEVIGVVEFVNKLSGAFDNDDLSLAETLAATASSALENARLVKALRTQTLDLQERNAELDAFGHTVAHDLQNMLTRVVGYAEYLVMTAHESPEDITPDTVHNSSIVIARNGRKMASVIDALMLLSAVREAKAVYTKIDMAFIVSEVQDRLAEWIKEIEAEIDLPDHWLIAKGYGPWIEEIWYNYMTNALKYGGTPPILSLGAHFDPAKEMIVFWVRDQGPGIAKKDQELLFRPFADLGSKRKNGHGLGLSIVERIVRKMGGDVGVESEEGAGSRFWFSLPAYTESPRTSKPIKPIITG